MEAERANRLQLLPKLFSLRSIGSGNPGEILESTIVIGVILPRFFLFVPETLLVALTPVDLGFGFPDSYWFCRPTWVSRLGPPKDLICSADDLGEGCWTGRYRAAHCSTSC
ncbi:hypothetical protein U1Q18_015250 [Sarracenia purpurea var. burkii]